MVLQWVVLFSGEWEEIANEDLRAFFMGDNSLKITDNRTGRIYQIEIEDGAVRALDLRKIKLDDDDFGLITYDPGFSNTGSCKSRITFIDGEKGILRYRGYPIDELAESVSFLEVSYLIFHGELPDKGQLDEWTRAIRSHADPPPKIRELIQTFPPESSAMGMLMSAVAALSGVYSEAVDVTDPENRRTHLTRLMGSVPTLIAFVYRHKMGLSFLDPDPDKPFVDDFIRLVFGETDSVFSEALDVLFTLHADHEQNCSANAMRSVGSSLADPYMATASAMGALAGTLHGGANEAVLKMLESISSVDRVGEHMARVKKGEVRLMGFGHRIYKNYDPRAKIIKRLADSVFKVAEPSPLLDLAQELEVIALKDDYFLKRGLYPNVDFYSGITYRAIGFPNWMFTALFALARTSGWVSQWEEFITDPESRIARPRQVYLGSDLRHYP
jgi:citrate synthase